MKTSRCTAQRCGTPPLGGVGLHGALGDLMGSSAKWIMAPFEDGYVVESVIRAQTHCVLIGRKLLQQTINDEILKIADRNDLEFGIVSNILPRLISWLPDRQLWRILAEFGIIGSKLRKSLQKSLDYRNKLSHDLWRGLLDQESEEKREEAKRKLEQMVTNRSKLLEILRTRSSRGSAVDEDGSPSPHL